VWREAPPSVSLYGIVDLGVSYNQVSRAGNAIGGAVNASLVGMVSGVLSGSRWVIKGAEQLSPEWSSSFVLESGINAQDGSIAEEGLTIGRQASLTMTHEQYGSLTLERRGALAYTYLVTIDPFRCQAAKPAWGFRLVPPMGFVPITSLSTRCPLSMAGKPVSATRLTLDLLHFASTAPPRSNKPAYNTTVLPMCVYYPNEPILTYGHPTATTIKFSVPPEVRSQAPACGMSSNNQSIKEQQHGHEQKNANKEQSHFQVQHESQY